MKTPTASSQDMDEKKGRNIKTQLQKSTPKQIVMNIFLWLLQGLLAVAFLAHGWLFLSPPADMVEAMNSSIPPALRLFIGVAEVLAALGLTLPGVTRIRPWLISYAAAGLMMVTISATLLHLTRGELSYAVTTAVLFVVVAFVAYMRWKVKPILARAKA
jgi:FtsH-binding integral membrane protein